jgi:hypothetical protein
MLIPDNLQEFDSRGERFIYYRFKKDPNTRDYFVLHSVFTNHHLTNVSGELDFLVLAPGLGFFAIEVKHGKVERADGTWIFTDYEGNPTKKSKGPFRQVEDTKHSIRNYILESISGNKKLYNKLSKVLFATGVAFTSTPHDKLNIGPEGFPWQIFTEEDLRLPISKYIKRLSDGWHDEYSKHPWYDVNSSRPTVDDCEKVLKILRGDFKIDYTELNRISDNQKLIEEFTQEQFKVLDFTEFNQRCLIEGQAGTGKTVIALEITRRKLQEGKRVALFCFNQKLGEKLNRSLTNVFDNNNIFYAGTFHRYLSKNVSTELKSGNDDEYYSESLPLEFLIQMEELSEDQKFDMLIIDETQDLLTTNYLEVFDWILKGGIKNGQWTMFGDFTNQAIYINDPVKAKNLLLQRAFFVNVPPLKLNCRNTKKIAEQNTLITGIDEPNFTGLTLPGISVDVQFPRNNNQRDTLENKVKELISSGIGPELITLLSPKKFENTFLYDSEFILDQIKKGLEVSTIHSYKGLENVVIVLYDFSEIQSESAIRLLYIGISRATQQLNIILNQNLEQSYQKLVSANSLKLK